MARLTVPSAAGRRQPRRQLFIWLAVIAMMGFLLMTPTALAGVTDPSGHWTWQQTEPEGNDLTAVFARSDSDIWAVGRSGSIIHSTDGGGTWASVPSSTDYDLADISFRGETGWIAGDVGDVLRTTDGGATWTQGSLGLTGSFTKLSFVSDQLGWASSAWDNGLYRTTDGGLGWKRVYPPGTQEWQFWMWADMSSVDFSDADHGWAVGGEDDWFGETLHTTNGGASWVAVTPDGDPYLSDIAALGNNVAVACGDGGVIVRTTDSGLDWTRVRSDGNPRLSALCFVGSEVGWAVGEMGVILKTTDGGVTWVDQHTPDFPVSDLYAVSFSDAERGWAVGESGTILRTTDGGDDWSFASQGPDGGLNDIAFADQQKGVAVGQRTDGVGVLQTTTDGGATWLSVDEPVVGCLNGATWQGIDNAWAVGVGGTILHSSDAGASWQRQASRTRDDLYDVRFCDPLHGWAMSDDGAYATTDGGASWQRKLVRLPSDLPETEQWTELFAVEPADAATVWAVRTVEKPPTYDDYAELLCSTDAGARWTTVRSLKDRSLYDVAFVDPQHGWAAGDTGFVLTTTDSGASWSEQTAPAEAVWGLQFVDTTHGWAWADDGTLLTTIDGGTHWGVVPTRIDDAAGVSFVDPLDGWLARTGGGVLHTADGGGISPATDCKVTRTSRKGWWPWNNAPVTLTLTDVDDGLGLGTTEHRVNNDAWTAGTVIHFAAPGNHSKDGLYTTLFRSTDAAGNVGPTDEHELVIDTRKPSVFAPRVASAKVGRHPILKIGATDALSPMVLVKIAVKNDRDKVVGRSADYIQVGFPHYVLQNVWLRKLPAGRYRFFVDGHDLAGNTVVKMVSNRLTIR